MIFGITKLAECVAARTFEIETGRVEEHEIELGKEITTSLEQTLFNDIFQTARCKGCSAILFFGLQLFAKPGHSAIQVMKVEIRNTVDPVIVPPALCCPIRSSGKQPMQNAQEDGPFKREAMLAVVSEFAEHGATADLLPQPLKDKGWTDPAHLCGRRCVLLLGIDEDRIGGKDPIAASAPTDRSRSTRHNGRALQSLTGAPAPHRADFQRSAGRRDHRWSFCGSTWSDSIGTSTESQTEPKKSGNTDEHVALHFWKSAHST